ncbi:Fur-regulated basic protein FbpA [Ginsengibacter hankyongi]
MALPKFKTYYSNRHLVELSLTELKKEL